MTMSSVEVGFSTISFAANVSRSMAIWSLLFAASVASATSLPTTPIRLKTHTRTFNTRYEFALHEGRIHFRPLAGGAWALLNGTGLPVRNEGPKADDPKEVLQIAADANALIAIDPDQRIYDAVIADAESRKLHWNYGWGFPFRALPAPVFLPKDKRDWTYSLI